jgi:hypothetical protein
LAPRRQYHLSPEQEGATVLGLWPLLLDLLQPVMTHATIRTLQDCYALDLLEAPPYVVETCRQVHAREVAARKTDRRSLVRRWLEPKALDLDPAAADDATILRVLGPTPGPRSSPATTRRRYSSVATPPPTSQRD